MRTLLELTTVIVGFLALCSHLKGQPAPEATGFIVTKIHGDSAGGSILDTGQKEAFDASWATCPTVLHDGRVYRMWYSSVYDSKMGRGGVGVASSQDGIHWMREHGGRPILEVGQKSNFDGGQVMGPEVLFDGKQYRMWYTGMALGRHRSGLGFYRIGLATSVDGVRWSRANEGKPVLDLGPKDAPDEVQAATPSILLDPTGYRMWYAAWSPRTDHTLCLARSRDGIHWERENMGRPVVGLDPSYAYGPAVCRWRDQYLLLYMSRLTQSRGLYAALSRDGIQWHMLNAGKPVLLPGSDADFDEYLVGHPFLLSFSGGVRIWYTGYRRDAAGVHGWKLRIGLAEMRGGQE